MEFAARRPQDPEVYRQQHAGLTKRYESVKGKLAAIDEKIKDRTARRAKILLYLEEVQAREGLLEAFDESLWRRVAEKAIVHSGGEITIEFKDGRQIWTKSGGK